MAKKLLTSSVSFKDVAQDEDSGDTSSGQDSDDAGLDSPDYDSDCLPVPGTNISRRELWRQTSTVRGAWLHRQLEASKKAIRDFQIGEEASIETPTWLNKGMSVTFKDVSFSIQVQGSNDFKTMETKSILDDCCGHYPAGSLVAIMGPSGCGKTTLLDILARKKTMAHTGQVFVNGHEADRLFPRISTYVDSNDTMPQHWTVREAVRFNFFLKGHVPVYRYFARERVNEVVDHLLEVLGLAHVSGSKIGGETVRGISSGQRRRVTLARGLVTGTPLLFLDEPTSGLSSTDAELCMKVLKIRTMMWRQTIFVVIHQPRVEVARLFDRLLLLTARPGRIVYDGHMVDAATYWTSLGYPMPAQANPTDYLLDVITPDAPGAQPDFFAAEFKRLLLPNIVLDVVAGLASPGSTAKEYLEDQHKALECFGRMPKVRNSQFSASFRGQVQEVGRRKLTLMLRDPVIIGMQVAVPLLEGAGLGFCFFGIAHKTPEGIMVISGWLNMLLMGVLFGGFTGVPQLIEDRILMQTEVGEALYSPFAHIMVGLLLDMAVTLVRNGIFITVMYVFAELPWTWGHFGPFFCWILLVGIVMDPIFKAAAAIAKDMQTATMAGLIFVLFIAVFNGIGFVTKKSAPAVLLPLLQIMPSSLVAEQVAWGLYGDDPAVWNTLNELMGLERTSPWTCGAILLAWFVVFNFAAAAALKYIKHVEK